MDTAFYSQDRWVLFLYGRVDHVDEGDAATRNCYNQEHVEGLPGGGQEDNVTQGEITAGRRDVKKTTRQEDKMAEGKVEEEKITY